MKDPRTAHLQRVHVLYSHSQDTSHYVTTQQPLSTPCGPSHLPPPLEPLNTPKTRTPKPEPRTPEARTEPPRTPCHYVRLMEVVSPPRRTRRFRRCGGLPQLRAAGHAPDAAGRKEEEALLRHREGRGEGVSEASEMHRGHDTTRVAVTASRRRGAAWRVATLNEAQKTEDEAERAERDGTRREPLLGVKVS